LVKQQTVEDDLTRPAQVIPDPTARFKVASPVILWPMREHDRSDGFWPGGAVAAVSLTYDDGNDNNLDIAIPQLDAAALRGTFYLATGFPRIRKRAAHWRAAFERGHEIGNHTVHHPCRADAFHPPPPWLTHPLEHYDADRIAAEIDEAHRWLDEHVGIDPHRTFAHPCCHTGIGRPADEQAYDRAIRRRHVAARIGGNRVNDPATVDLLRIASFFVDHPSADELISHCEAAAAGRGWTVLMFHGIGGPAFETAAAVHEALLDYLAQHRDRIWTAPLREVVGHVQKQRGGTMHGCC
jgi:peptidoglycan/xylan/chitin deacetylase (PgdA/CDA1 family)